MENSSKGPPLLSTAACGDLIVIEVGPEHRKYNVHKALFVHHSDYFRKALKEPWKEADRDGVTVLDDIEPGVFNVVVHWLYAQKLPVKYSEWYRLAEESCKVTTGALSVDMIQIKLYVFADRFAVPALQNAANNRMVANLIDDSSPQLYEIILYAYDNIPSTRRIFQFFADAFCAYWKDYNEPGEDQELRDMPRDFLLRTIKRYNRILTGSSRHELFAPNYYEFNPEEDIATYEDVCDEDDYH